MIWWFIYVLLSFEHIPMVFVDFVAGNVDNWLETVC